MNKLEEIVEKSNKQVERGWEVTKRKAKAEMKEEEVSGLAERWIGEERFENVLELGEEDRELARRKRDMDEKEREKDKIE